MHFSALARPACVEPCRQPARRPLISRALALLTMAGAVLLSGAVQAMNSEPLPVRVEREIVGLHGFFQDWYRGLGDVERFERFDRSLAADFVIIMPDGRVLSRSTIIEAVRSQRGSDPQARLEIRNVSLRQERGNTLVATYEEWQGRGGQPAEGRLSTVVFAADPDAGNGLIWLHVHETWLPGKNAQSRNTMEITD